MLTSAHTAILHAADRNKPFCPGDPAAEQYLISNGYCRYTETRPLMKLTAKGYDYARKERAWVKSGRTD